MAELRFTKDHEWLSIDGDIATVGISDYAQEQLGDVVFVELPAVGKSLKQGDEAAVIESVKAAAELYAPVDGEIVEVNASLADEPGTVNSSPMADGWFVKLHMSDKAQTSALMDEEAYNDFCAIL